MLSKLTRGPNVSCGALASNPRGCSWVGKFGGGGAVTINMTTISALPNTQTPSPTWPIRAKLLPHFTPMGLSHACFPLGAGPYSLLSLFSPQWPSRTHYSSFFPNLHGAVLRPGHTLYPCGASLVQGCPLSHSMWLNGAYHTFPRCWMGTTGWIWPTLWGTVYPAHGGEMVEHHSSNPFLEAPSDGPSTAL